MRSILALRKKSSAKNLTAAASSEFLAAVQSCVACDEVQTGWEPDRQRIYDAANHLYEVTTRTQEMESVAKFLGSLFAAGSNLHGQKAGLTVLTLGCLMCVENADFRAAVSRHTVKPFAHWIDKRRSEQELVSKSLGLLEAWAKGLPQYPEIADAYHALKKKEDLYWPRHTPQLLESADAIYAFERMGVSCDPDAPPPPSKPLSLRPSSLRAFGSAETASLRKDFDRFDSLFGSLEGELARCRDCSDLAENALIPELVIECDNVRPQLRSMIEIISSVHNGDGEALAPLLELNDRLLRLIRRYQELERTPRIARGETDNPFDDQELVMTALSDLHHRALVRSAPPLPVPVRTQRNDSAQGEEKAADRAKASPPAATVDEDNYNPFDEFDIL